MTVTSVGSLMSHDDFTFRFIEHLDEASRQYDLTTAAGEREREGLIVMGDLHAAGVVVVQLAVALEHGSRAHCVQGLSPVTP